MLDCHPGDTPMDPNVKLLLGQRESLEDLGCKLKHICVLRRIRTPYCFD